MPIVLLVTTWSEYNPAFTSTAGAGWRKMRFIPKPSVRVRLLGNGPTEKIEVRAGLSWITQFPAHPTAGGLWNLLLNRHAGQIEVRQVALEWLKACRDVRRRL